MESSSQQSKSKKSKSTATEPAVSTTQSASSPHEPADPGLPSPLKQSETSEKPEEEIDFETFYLKQVTTEFADDLDKLRNASDFTEKSMPVLIDALKGTARMYSDEEKADVMGAGR
ncbi:MAG: hypothetical protein Q9176_000980 [Flavoplaca citrina]